MTNVNVWNTIAISKTHWALAKTEDKLWLRWVHSYYIKGQQLETIRVPTQACWIIRKLNEARTTFDQFQVDESSGRSLTRQLYMHLLKPEP